MEESKILNPSAINALKQALANIYWFKKDLRSFLINTLEDASVLSRLNWEDYKQVIADKLVNFLLHGSAIGQDELLRLCEAITEIKDFSHLEYLEGGKMKAERARKAVEALRQYTEGHFSIRQEEERIKRNREKYLEKLENQSEFKERLSNINSQFITLINSNNHQQRGFKLEKLMRDLFDLFDMDPKSSFRNTGEQIDGAFTFDNIDFLFEAKWEDGFIGAKELDSLAAKVNRKLDNTLGLFLSINGFSEQGVAAHSSSERRKILLMDGSDLMAILDGRIDLQRLLRRKKREAAQTGNIYFRYSEMV